MSLARQQPRMEFREPVRISVSVKDARNQIWDGRLSGIHAESITVDRVPLHINQEKQRVTVFLKVETQHSSHELTIQARIARIELDASDSWDASAHLTFLDYNAGAWKALISAIEDEQSNIEKILEFIKKGDL